MSNNSKVIAVTYKAYSKFVVPDYLLSPEKNVEGTVGSWWIKWDTLYYINKVGKEVKAPQIYAADDGETFRYPDHCAEEATTECFGEDEFDGEIEDHIEEYGSW